MKDEISAWVEKYWPLPLKFDYTKPVEQEAQRIAEAIRKKYSLSVLKEYERRFKADQSATDSQQGWNKERRELVDFLFSTGMHEIINCDTFQRSRETLRSLLELLVNEKTPFTLIDFGCGDGKIAIGLCLYLEMLKRCYAIDMLQGAEKRLEKNILKLSEPEQEKVRKKVIPIRGDFTTEHIRKQVRGIEPGKTDIALSAYPAINFHDGILLFSRFTKWYGRIITFYQFGKSTKTNEFARELAEKNYQKEIWHHGLWVEQTKVETYNGKHTFLMAIIRKYI